MVDSPQRLNSSWINFAIRVFVFRIFGLHLTFAYLEFEKMPLICYRLKLVCYVVLTGLLVSCGVSAQDDTNYQAAVSIPVTLPPPSFKQTDREWDQYFKRIQQSREFSGTVLIADQGKVIHSGAYGYADLSNRDTLDLDAPFQLASVSKIFTATAVMILHERGKIDYDQSVQAYLPQFPYSSITVRHLLNHRSGLCRYMALSDTYWDKQQYIRNEDVLDLLTEHQPELWFVPGTQFNYINTNYALLALIVEQQAQMAFEVFLQKEIFDPLCMAHTWTARKRINDKIPNEVQGYKRRRKGYRHVGRDYLDGVLGDKGIYSTATDLFRFDQALYTEKLVTNETLAEAFSPGSEELITHNYGFGWRMKTWQQGLVYHFGWWRGFRSCFIRDMDSQKTIIILGNRDHLSNTPDYWDIYCRTLEMSPTSVATR